MKRSVGSSGRGNMRPGLISLLTVVIITSLSTAAVLTIATSHAMAALSQRQARMTTEGYDAERAAQTFVGLVDEELADARKSETSASALMERLENDANMLLAKACPQGITATYSVEDTTLTCTFVTENGRMLQTSIEVGDDATYSIASWKLTAAPEIEDNGDTLWTGPTAGE